MHRRGYTLAEMLIVMAIMIMLVAVTLPTIKNVIQDGALREASRQFNAYLAMAKARALHTGRPCGVLMMCDLPLGVGEPAFTSATPYWPAKMVTRMYLAEVPPPYAGGTLGARGRIMFSQQPSAPAGTLCFYPLVLGNTTPDGSPAAPGGEFSVISSLLQPGEFFLVRFDYKGAWYICQFVSPGGGTQPEFVYRAPGANPPIAGTTSAGFPTPLPPGFTSNGPINGYIGNTFQIIRMPRRIGNPLELPAGTCLDLTYSGIGPTNLPSNRFEFGMYPAPGPTTGYPLRTMAVMFTPGGGIDSVYLNNFFFTPPTTVHFLVGKTDRVSPPAPTPYLPLPGIGISQNSPTGLAMFDPETSNLLDPQALWVSISRSTGNVTTSDNLPPPILGATNSSLMIMNGAGVSQSLNLGVPADITLYLSYCRQLATNRDRPAAQ